MWPTEGDLTCRGSERATARRRRRSGEVREMEEGLGSVESRGECAPIRHFTSLRTRQWLGVRLASLSVPPVAPSLTPRPSQLAHKGLHSTRQDLFGVSLVQRKHNRTAILLMNSNSRRQHPSNLVHPPLGSGWPNPRSRDMVRWNRPPDLLLNR
jgi:hypothetical protein